MARDNCHLSLDSESDSGDGVVSSGGVGGGGNGRGSSGRLVGGVIDEMRVEDGLQPLPMGSQLGASNGFTPVSSDFQFGCSGRIFPSGSSDELISDMSAMHTVVESRNCGNGMVGNGGAILAEQLGVNYDRRYAILPSISSSTEFGILDIA